MDRSTFYTTDGRAVPAVTAEEMRAVDRAAVDEVGLSLLMMMEHAGRALAETVLEVAPAGLVTVAAGAGGNGGGGLCAARLLANHGVPVAVVLDREPSALAGAAARQWRVLGGAAADRSADPDGAFEEATVVADAIVGYSLAGALHGRAAELVEAIEARADAVVSLDVPTGVDATTGERPGPAVEPDATVTLARPKEGLTGGAGDLVLADLGIPARAFELAGLDGESPFTGDCWRLELSSTRSG